MSASIQYLGHSCILITSCAGRKILVDPYLSENEHAVVQPQDLKDINAILISHGAFDHIGDAFAIAKNTGATVFSDIVVLKYAIARGVPREKTRALIYGTNLVQDGVQIRSIEAKHISHFSYDGKDVTGVAMSFVIRLEDGTGIYFSGDTSIYSDMKFFGELYPVKIGFFCVSGLPGLAYEMDGREGALAAKMFNPEIAIPIHCSPDDPEITAFTKELGRIAPTVRPLVLKPGEILPL
ncbi:conserved hypothetical protein [uncultured delta proteobacterium]|uniref:Metallo-beta-lactamase domain-containing protein n=1 Tax=uncultured delta proteobacterium TaxID=34034 RepID=A0A212K2T6_9DELT|nr:conserved hypothetical protein [uncultured delta proteobacterium]